MNALRDTVQIIMTSFLTTQLDFILFFYGLAFILLGATCVAISRVGNRRDSWMVLALFGFFHGGSEWLDLSALVVGDTPLFALARTAVMTASFVLLMEFARVEAVRLGLKVPGRWIYGPLLAFVVIAGALFGLNAAGATARYALGFFGALASAAIFVRLSRGFSGATKYLALGAAAGFALYAVAAGFVVPSSPIWPSSIVNQDSFAHLTRLPIQLVRGLLACWIAFAIWGIWGQKLISDVSSTRYTQFLHRQFIWTVVAMLAILVAGWALTETLGGIYKENVQKSARGDIDLVASHLAGETATVEGMVQSLAGTPVMVALLGGDTSVAVHAKAILDLDIAASGAKLGFILNKAGAVVVSSDRREFEATGVPDYREMPYFQKAMAGQAGYHFAFNTVQTKPNFYASYPIRASDGKILGVAVLMKPLDAFATDLREFDHAYFLIDPNGVVVLSNRTDMTLRALWPLAPEKQAALTRQYGTLDSRPLVASDIADAAWIGFGGQRNYVRRRFADHSAWSLVILSPIQEIYASRVLGIVITLLVSIMTLIYLFGRERFVHDTIQMENRLALQELARDLRFRATTDPLTGLYNRLKFEEALASEMVKSACYQTPLALILYDVDRFKAINDTHGHPAGDKVLTELSNFVARNIRNADVLARWGGEEFIVMLPSCDGAMAFAAAEKLRAAIDTQNFGEIGTVTCSFGVAQYADGDSATTLIARADSALYRAKVNGRDRVELAALPDSASFASVA